MKISLEKLSCPPNKKCSVLNRYFTLSKMEPFWNWKIKGPKPEKIQTFGSCCRGSCFTFAGWHVPYCRGVFAFGQLGSNSNQTSREWRIHASRHTKGLQAHTLNAFIGRGVLEGLKPSEPAWSWFESPQILFTCDLTAWSLNVIIIG